MVFPAGFRAPRGNLANRPKILLAKFAQTAQIISRKTDEPLIQHRFLNSGVFCPKFKIFLKSQHQPTKKRISTSTHIPTYDTATL